MKIIDSHCHIDWFEAKDLPEIIEDVSEIYAVSISYESSLKVLAMFQLAVGLHNHHLK